MKKYIAWILILLIAVPKPAFAWAETGHRLVALLAFNLLNPDEQQKLVAVLEKHPRLKEDFTPPNFLRTDDDKLKWRIGTAAYWPDLIRRNPTYDRPSWHYERAATLVIGDATKLQVPRPLKPLSPEATLETQSLYISQALELCRRTLADKKAAEPDRAVALCWIAHLVGDAHQPCHAGSLFMENVFTEFDGDRGANRIMTEQTRNMHALWDQLLGDGFTLNDVRRRLVEISTDKELVALGKASLKVKEPLDPQTWLTESRAAAVKNVYTPEVLEVLQRVARGLVKQPEPIDLSEEYLKNAGRVAQGRVSEAAYRLAEVWREALTEGRSN